MLNVCCVFVWKWLTPLCKEHLLNFFLSQTSDPKQIYLLKSKNQKHYVSMICIFLLHWMTRLSTSNKSFDNTTQCLSVRIAVIFGYFYEYPTVSWDNCSSHVYISNNMSILDNVLFRMETRTVFVLHTVLCEKVELKILILCTLLQFLDPS